MDTTYDLAMTNSFSTRPEPVELTAADGYPIAALRFTARNPPSGHLIVAGATGVRQSYYLPFARYACQRGFTVLTLDYRGIGKSKPPTLRGFQADLLDWAGYDLAAAVEYMTSDTVPLYMVGHSSGGHGLGLLPNHHRIDRAYVFGTGAGWHGWMPLRESVRVRLLWRVILPVLSLRGYAPMSLLGICEDLPLGVYRQWRHWCSFPHYFFDDPEMADIAEKFSEVRTPICGANAWDDLWAQPRSRDAFLQGYTNAPVTGVDLDPETLRGGIGHVGYFRRQARPLWDGVLRWFSSPLPGLAVPFPHCRKS